MYINQIELFSKLLMVEEAKSVKGATVIPKSEEILQAVNIFIEEMEKEDNKQKFTEVEVLRKSLLELDNNKVFENKLAKIVLTEIKKSGFKQLTESQYNSVKKLIKSVARSILREEK